jgi:uncharacterized protein (DUF4415 family)
VSAKRTGTPSLPSQAPTQGRANLAKLRRVTEAELQRSSPPELRELPRDFWDEAVPTLPAAKVPISLRVDSDVLDFFREAGPRYQSRMNAVLRSYMERTVATPKRATRRGIA